jgi:hypothetical protein
VRHFVCLGLTLVLSSVPAGAQQITGQAVGTNGASTSARFGVFGSVEPVGQARSSSARFSIAPLTPTKRDSIFASNFE